MKTFNPLSFWEKSEHWCQSHVRSVAVKSLNFFWSPQWDWTRAVISMFVFPCKGRTTDADCLCVCHSRGVTLSVCTRDVRCIHSNANGQIGAFHQWMCRFTDILSVIEHAFYHKLYTAQPVCIVWDNMWTIEWSGTLEVLCDTIYIYLFNNSWAWLWFCGMTELTTVQQ